MRGEKICIKGNVTRSRYFMRIEGLELVRYSDIFSCTIILIGNELGIYIAPPFKRLLITNLRRELCTAL